VRGRCEERPWQHHGARPRPVEHDGHVSSNAADLARKVGTSRIEIVLPQLRRNVDAPGFVHPDEQDEAQPQRGRP